jgi:hypothetical protein
LGEFRGISPDLGEFPGTLPKSTDSMTTAISSPDYFTGVIFYGLPEQ